MLVALVGSDPRFLARHGPQTRRARRRDADGIDHVGRRPRAVDCEERPRGRGGALCHRDPRGKAFGSLDAYEAQWPIRYVQAGLPPFLFLIAESEQVNPPILKTNQKFVDDARALGNQASLTVFTGRTHYSNIRKHPRAR